MGDRRMGGEGKQFLTLFLFNFLILDDVTE